MQPLTNTNKANTKAPAPLGGNKPIYAAVEVCRPGTRIFVSFVVDLSTNTLYAGGKPVRGRDFIRARDSNRENPLEFAQTYAGDYVEKRLRPSGFTLVGDRASDIANLNLRQSAVMAAHSNYEKYQRKAEASNSFSDCELPSEAKLA